MLVFTPQKGMGMYRSIRWVVSVIALHGSIIFSADTNHILQLPQDILVNVYNFLPLKDKFNLALVCKTLCMVFENNPLIPLDGIEKYAVPSQWGSQSLQCESFCNRVNANQIRDAITFKSDLYPLKKFLEALKNNSGITHVQFYEKSLKDKEILTLKYDLETLKIPSITSIDLSDNNEISLLCIIRFIKIFPNLKELNLSGTKATSVQISDIETKEIIITNTASMLELKALGHAIPQLEKFHMNHCQLKSQQVPFFIDFLKKNATLKELSLKNNHIEIQEALPLIDLVNKENKTLEKLDLSDNPLRSYDHQHFARNGLEIIT